MLQGEGGRSVCRFKTKNEANTGGVLEAAVGGNGGTVRIHRENGAFEEERTVPRSRDPRSAPG